MKQTFASCLLDVDDGVLLSIRLFQNNAVRQSVSGFYLGL